MKICEITFEGLKVGMKFKSVDFDETREYFEIISWNNLARL